MSEQANLRACLLSTGEEVLRGEIADGNNRYLAETLGDNGFSIELMMTAGDRREDLEFAMTTSLSRADYLFVSGGLGPTDDDLTAEVIARLAGVDLEFDDTSWQAIVALFKKYKLEATDNNRKQAMIPAGATVLPNANGTAPGFACPLSIDGATKTIVALPGPPRELQPMLSTYLSELRKDAPPQREHLYIRFLGIGESPLSDILSPWTKQWGEVSYRQAFPEMEIKLYRPEPEKAAALCKFAEEQLGDYLLDFGPRSTVDLFTDYMKDQGTKLALAESCTGGLAAKLVTDVAGSSNYFLGAVISYDNSVKEQQLGVEGETLVRAGAVSEVVAQQMADGARQRLGADLALSFTGIAGPGGGSEEKPVGTVWMAKSTSTRTQTRRLQLIDLGRDRVRTAAAYQGLRWLMEDWLPQHRIRQR